MAHRWLPGQAPGGLGLLKGHYLTAPNPTQPAQIHLCLIPPYPPYVTAGREGADHDLCHSGTRIYKIAILYHTLIEIPADNRQITVDWVQF